MELHERKSMYVKCFEPIARPSIKVKRVKRSDPDFESPADAHAVVHGPTVRVMVTPTAIPGFINPRLLELAKYGR